MVMGWKDREQMERLIVERAVNDILAAGYRLSVFDGEEYAVKSSVSARAIMGALFETEEDYLYLMEKGDDGKIQRTGWVRLVYGGGWDVISDYSPNLDGVLAKAKELSEKMMSARSGKIEIIDITPTWGEIGALYTRFAESGEAEACKEMRDKAASAFALAHALKEIRDRLPEDLDEDVWTIYRTEMEKLGYPRDEIDHDDDASPSR